MRIGTSEVNITPVDLPAELAGYGYFRERQATTVEHALSATALTFEDESGNRAAMVGMDTHSVDADIVSKVRDQLTTKTDGELADTILLLNASHTHSSVGTHHLIGAGERNDAYVDTVLVPKLTDAIIAGFRSASDGEIGIARASTEDLSYNRTGGESLDSRVTAVRADTEHQRFGGIHMPTHPVVYGGNSTVISPDFPGYARDTLQRSVNTSQELWLTGTAGDIDPLINKTRKGATTLEDISALGEAVGLHGADLYRAAKLGDGALRAVQTTVEIPVNVDFELDPDREAAAYREARQLPKTQNLDPLKRWLKIAEPIVNGNTAPTIAIPVTFIAIGKLVFAGFGAEIYNETGSTIEQAHPDLDIVTTMISNEHLGYIPPRREYDGDAYAARSSAFIFGRKPLTPDSEEIFQRGVNRALDSLKATL